MEYDKTKLNYETAHTWHAEKSGMYDWAPQIEIFLQLLPAGSKVLDVGCGDGRDLRTFRKKGIEVEGLDYSKSAVESLRKQFPDGKFYETDMRATGLANNMFDGIWSCAAVLNVKKKDIPTVFAEFKRLLKQKGTVFLSVKEGEGERMVPDKAGERFFSFYSEAEIKTLVEKVGFRVNHTEVMEDTFNKAAPGVTLPRWISLYAQKP